MEKEQDQQFGLNDETKINFSMVEYDLIKMPGVNATDIGVYAALKMYANEKTDQCFPSVKTLANHCELSAPTVIKSIKRLESLGIIEKEERINENKGQTSNLYAIYGPYGKELYIAMKAIKEKYKNRMKKLTEELERVKNAGNGQKKSRKHDFNGYGGQRKYNDDSLEAQLLGREDYDPEKLKG